jgi:hypothetical protein
MERRPTHFTIRAIAFATFWLGICFAALGVARSGGPGRPAIAPSVSFVLAVLSLCAAAYALLKNAPTKETSVNLKAATAAIIVWNLAVLPMALAYPNTLGKLLLVTYEAIFGEIQASYGAFSRLAMYLAFAAITLPATFVAVWLFDRLSRRSLRWRQAGLSILIWEVLVILVLVSSYEIGFSYSLNQVCWAVFGPPNDLYGFRNIVLPRIIAWLIETTPVAWTSLWLHSKLS